jgi:hypothetical protein
MAKKAPQSSYTPRSVNVNMSFGQILLLIVIGAGVAVGLFTVFESLGANKAVFRAITKVGASVVTVFTTYFLINRALRLRERESDTILVSFMGYIEYLVKTYALSYGDGPEDDPACNHHLDAVRGMEWEEIEDYSARLNVSTQTLPRFMTDAICWKSYLRTAEERMLDIHHATDRIVNLLGVCSPQMATVAMEVSDQYSDIFADDLPVIRRGIRGFDKLDRIMTYGAYVQDPRYHKDLEQDIAESISAILEGLQYTFQKLPNTLDAEMTAALTGFRQNLHKRYQAAYDAELEDLGEKFDID